MLSGKQEGTGEVPGVASHTAELGLSLLVSLVPEESPGGTCHCLTSDVAQPTLRGCLGREMNAHPAPQSLLVPNFLLLYTQELSGSTKDLVPPCQRH